jgi:ArsR family transcriptional regulator, zinc-responsive transcriptional repressor
MFGNPQPHLFQGQSQLMPKTKAIQATSAATIPAPTYAPGFVGQDPIPGPHANGTPNGQASQEAPRRRGRPPGKRNAVPAPPIAQSTPQRRVSATPPAPPRPPGPSLEVRQAAMLLKQASDSTRLQVLLILAEGERNVGQLCADLGNMSQPATSHHLALLRHSRLIEPRRSGKSNYYSLSEEGRALATVVSGLVGGQPR